MFFNLSTICFYVITEGEGLNFGSVLKQNLKYRVKIEKKWERITIKVKKSVI